VPVFAISRTPSSLATTRRSGAPDATGAAGGVFAGVDAATAAEAVGAGFFSDSVAGLGGDELQPIRTRSAGPHRPDQP
jgi:hypothetical protein